MVFLGSPIFSKKRTNNSTLLLWYVPQVDLFLFVFWRKLTTPRNHFEINWPLVVYWRKWDEIPVKVGSLISMHQNFHKTLHIMRIRKLKKFLVKTLVQKDRICCQLFWSTFRRWNYVKLPWDCLCEKQPNLCNAHLLQTTSCR